MDIQKKTTGDTCSLQELSVTKGGHGYALTSSSVTWFFNALLALVFLLAGAPLLICLALFVKLRSDGPVFYSGVRLGLFKKHFIMYKFRTLPVGMQQQLGATLFSPKVKKLPFFCKFLRDTRLDELPQLFNIIRGDMDFIGPRPLRPEVYQRHCTSIPGFDRRFLVRPGLIGYSQLFTPHSSPKRIRALIDNRSISMKRSHRWDLYVIFLTVAAVVKKVILMSGSFLYEKMIRSKTLKVYAEKRFLDRVKVRDAEMLLFTATGSAIWKGKVIDMNETHLKVASDMPVPADAGVVRMERYVRKKNSLRRKIARCNVSKSRDFSDPSRSKYIYVFKYEPQSELQRYMIDQYFMKKSVIQFG